MAPLDSLDSVLLDLLASLVLLPAYGILASTHFFFIVIKQLCAAVTEAQLRFVDVDDGVFTVPLKGRESPPPYERPTSKKSEL